MPLRIPSAPPFISHPRRTRAPVVEPLTLVSVGYASGDGTITLTFDRAIDIAAIEVGAVTVNDGSVGITHQGSVPATLSGAAEVTMGVNGIEDFAGPDVRLTVTAGNGIVASGDGAAWAGEGGCGLASSLRACVPSRLRAYPPRLPHRL